MSTIHGPAMQQFVDRRHLTGKWPEHTHLSFLSRIDDRPAGCDDERRHRGAGGTGRSWRRQRVREAVREERGTGVCRLYPHDGRPAERSRVHTRRVRARLGATVDVSWRGGVRNMDASTDSERGAHGEAWRPAARGANSFRPRTKTAASDGTSAGRPRMSSRGSTSRSAIASLPPRAREVFVLHDVEGYKHDEIAERLELQASSVRAQLHRARQLIMRMLNR